MIWGLWSLEMAQWQFPGDWQGLKTGEKRHGKWTLCKANTFPLTLLRFVTCNSSELSSQVLASRPTIWPTLLVSLPTMGDAESGSHPFFEVRIRYVSLAPPTFCPCTRDRINWKKMENSFYQPLATRSSNGLTSWEGGKLAFSWKPPKQTQTSQLSNLSDLNNQTKTYKRWCNNFYVLHLPLRNDVVDHPKSGWFHV